MPVHRQLLLALGICALAACGAPDTSAPVDADPPPDAGPAADTMPPARDMEVTEPDMVEPEPDMADPDARPDLGAPCMPAEEVCDGVDQDCDGRVDEDVRFERFDGGGCGLNGRGQQPVACVDGAPSVDGPCVDPDVCVDGDRQDDACPDLTGRRSRSCEEGQWSDWSACAGGVCTAPADARVGDNRVDLSAGPARTPPSCGGRGAEHAWRFVAPARGRFAFGADETLFDAVLSVRRSCADPATELACGDVEGADRLILELAADEAVVAFVHAVDPQAAGSAVLSIAAAEDESCNLRDDDLDGQVDEGPEGQLRQRVACGLNGRGVQERRCMEGAFVDAGACVDTDTCVDGAIEREPCGLNGRGTRMRACVAGAFGAPGDCVDDDACVDGAREERACGARGDGVETRRCDDGQWRDWGACEGACIDACAAGAARCAGDGVEVCGDSDADPCLEWGPAQACEPGLRCRSGACAVPVVINEVFYDQIGADGSETFVELWGPPGLTVEGLSLVAVDGGDGRDYATLPLAGAVGDDGYYVVADPAASPALAALADLLVDGADLQNGPDGLQLRRGDAVVDAVGYGEAAVFAGEGRPAADPAAGNGLSRVERADTDDNAVDFVAALVSPRGEPADGLPECGSGDAEAAACGLNGRGEHQRMCTVGRWSPWVCDDPDVCEDGATADRPCPGERQQASVCDAGRWVPDGACIGLREDISEGGIFPGFALPADGLDAYPLPLLADWVVRLEVSDGAGGCPGDAIIEVDRIEPDGQRIYVDGDDDTGIGVCPLLEVEFAAGDYIVRVSGLDGQLVGDYVLDVTLYVGQ